jgi:hypothetical protein
MMANCAAMGIPPRAARDLTLWEYEATLVQWNVAHDTDPKVEPPTVDEVEASAQFFLDHPELLQVSPDELMN